MGEPPRPVASLIGRKLGQYDVKSLIGRGASGTVYLAEDCALHRPVALKVLLGSLARSAEQSVALQQEAQAAAPLRHPNVVRIYAAGIEDGIPYIAMEYVRGEPLDHFLRRHGRLAWQQALHIGRQLAEALAEAHRHDIVHCDVKPANILLDVQGRVRLTDFGIATVHRRQGGQHAPTRVIGTLPYMAPEQCRGEGDFSAATDLYGLGASLYQIIGGAPPFVRQSAEAILNCIYYEVPLRLNHLRPDLPDDVSRLVAHLLEKAPADRPPSAREVSQRIAQLLQQNGGRSAYPDAIETFLREQMEPRGNHVVRPVTRAVTPRPDEKPARACQQPRETRSLSEWAKVAVAAMLLFALCGTGYWYLLRPRTMMHLAPPAPATEFLNIAPDLKLAHWALPHMKPAALAWEHGDRLVMAIEGTSGTLSAGAAALMTIEPEREQALVLAAVDAPAQNAAYWQAPRVLASRFSVSNGVSNAMVVPILLPAPADAIALRRQDMDAAVSAGIPLLQVKAAEMAPDLLNPWTSLPSGGMAMHPDGAQAALVMQDSSGHYLAALRLDETSASPVRISASAGPILKDSLCFTHDGKQLLFLRRNSPGLTALSSLPWSGGLQPERMLFEGNIEGAIAPARAKSFAAVSVRHGDSVKTYVVDYAADIAPAPLGSGRVSRQSWSPSAQWLALIDEQHRAPTVFLQSLEGTPPVEVPLPLQCRSVLEAAVSPDGRWLAVSSMSDGGPAVVFVNLLLHPATSGGAQLERT